MPCRAVKTQILTILVPPFAIIPSNIVFTKVPSKVLEETPTGPKEGLEAR